MILKLVETIGKNMTALIGRGHCDEQGHRYCPNANCPKFGQQFATGTHCPEISCGFYFMPGTVQEVAARQRER